MRSYLPDIRNRSITPSSVKNKDSPLKSAAFARSLRKISLSPLSSSSRKESNELILNTRAVSDEITLIPLEHDPLFQRLSRVHKEKINRAKGLIQRIPISFENIKSFSEAIDALFTMYNCERGRLGAFTLAQLFLSLGYSENADQIIEILKNISEGQNFHNISYSKRDLLKICEDIKTDNILQHLLSELKTKPTSGYLQALVNVLKKWWSRLDKSQNGFVSVEDICKFFTEVGVIDSSSDTKRILLKISQFGTYKQFASFFSKSLLKYLLTELTNVVKQGNANCLSGEMAICTQRRKIILQCFEGQNHVIDAINKCDIHNN